MKKAILVFVFIISQLSSFSQSTYYAFPDSNALWIETHQYGGTFPCVQNWDREIYISKDTLINGVQYKKLLYNEHYYVQYSPWCSSTISNYSYGLLYGYYRNDTTNKKMYLMNYFWTGGSSPDSLLYDFSKLVGDTVNSFMGHYRIDSIKNILLGGNTRREFFVNYFASLNTSGQTNILEGIGSAQGLVTNPDDWEGSDVLQCFSQNLTKLYPDTNGVCQHIVSVSGAQKPKVNIYPNPASDKIYFDRLNSAKIRLIDVTGRIVMETQLTENSIDISECNNGIYFLDVVQEGKIIERKKIIISR